MRIKHIAIEGFKSYARLEVGEDEFHPHVNVIVGRNGSGKSNLFDAIRFVLSEPLSSLRAEERRQLLWESSGDRVMSAYVEIVFDNEDGRIPVASAKDSTDVVLKRHLGLQKDEYYINNKHVTKQEVVDLLESAGFSRSNPFYIVQQGKVNALAMMKPKQRLELLKEVAGTKVYEQKKEEAMKLIENANHHRTQSEELLEYIGDRLEELEEERDELKEFMKVDRRKRAVEYTIYEAQLNDASTKLQRIEELQKNESAESSRIFALAAEAHDRVKDAEREIKSCSNEARVLRVDKEQAEEERKELMGKKAKLELELQDLRVRAQRREEEASSQEVLDELESRIAHTEVELEQASSTFSDIEQRERQVSVRIREAEVVLSSIYAKLGRSAQYKSKTQRDKALRVELSEIAKQAETKAQQVERTKSQLQDAEQLIEKLEGELEEHETARAQALEEREGLIKQITALKSRRDTLSTSRKEYWRSDADTDEGMRKLREELHQFQRALNSTLSKATSTGVNSVSQLVAQHGIEGVHGPLINLFSCQEGFMAAVEVIGGNRLFHIVTDTHTTAARLASLLERDPDSGRVSFLPLDKISGHAHPPTGGAEATPLIDLLEFRPMYRPAMEHIFGSTLLCRTLETAMVMARTQNVDCVTPHGDKVNAKCALTGGSFETRDSRLALMQKIRDRQVEIDKASDDANKVHEQVEEINTQINEVLVELQKKSTQVQARSATMEQIMIDIRHKQSVIRSERETVQHLRKTLYELEAALSKLQDTQNALEEEMGTELHSQLEEQEQQTLEATSSELATLRDELSVCTRERAEAEAKKKELEYLLNTNLYRQRDEAQDSATRGSSLSNMQQRLEQLEEEHRTTSEGAHEVLERLEGIKNQIERCTTKEEELSMQLDDLKQAEYKQKQAIQKENSAMEKLLNKRSLLLQQKEDSTRKIRELGAVPTEHEKYQGKPMKELLRILQRTTAELKKYPNINKKALTQFDRFTSQRDDQIRRSEELEESNAALMQLIATLDQRKDEAIERTFKGVAKEFNAIFSELVPQGRANVVMKMRPAQGDDDHTIRRYSGVQIKAAFKAGEEPHRIEQLSGGEKTLVAIALIFAIQRCDPAPFYLFDEIDSALDPNHREAVARLIASQKEAQFILSTFKPELVKQADQAYHVTMVNRRSEQRLVDVRDALDIIEAGQEDVGPSADVGPDADQ
eukprot:TRINITY_DN7430_c0_g1_i4.p1 TRINITY_DN7430_c0_g1~~TRINITY_DN7430_c0_g1_i4.p1  ORF type:complete len:1203 (-),score=361.00 TRINITY_DN7430_c0_g1_i4:412-4020(-)